jgi:hypothetical protein
VLVRAIGSLERKRHCRYAQLLRGATRPLDSMNEQTDRDGAAKHRCYGKRDQVKVGETRFQVEMHPRIHTRI